ncbi:MAG: ABC transporter permease [Bacteroidetes bacterium]|nr:ABC transporter permease [Bacteroidota bacterium]
MANKLKSVLTALGIIFGVAAVISMLAIGNGAKQEILEQMKQVGVNNIIIKPIVSEDLAKSKEDKKAPQKYSKGLCMADVTAIIKIIPTIRKVSPEILIDSYVIQGGKRKSAKLLGITPEYFKLFNLQLQAGDIFNEYQCNHGVEVCIIGEGLKTKLFSKGSPMNQYIKCGDVWLKIIGIMEKRVFSSSTNENLGIASSNESIYIPIKTMLMRYKNRSLITARMFSKGWDDESSTEKKAVNYNQLDKIIVQVNETEFVNTTKEILQRLILRRHSGVEDFEISVPELLLKQQQRTKDIFNLVLGAIASISLIVGGIGIMNIMLASVMERIKEIGTRLAIGATKKDIIIQFLSESTLISLTGGFIGIFLGIMLSVLITKFSGILTIVSVFSVIIAFGISVAIGIAFGYMPARRAAEKDPVESLRYE